MWTSILSCAASRFHEAESGRFVSRDLSSIGCRDWSSSRNATLAGCSFYQSMDGLSLSFIFHFIIFTDHMCWEVTKSTSHWWSFVIFPFIVSWAFFLLKWLVSCMPGGMQLASDIFTVDLGPASLWECGLKGAHWVLDNKYSNDIWYAGC